MINIPSDDKNLIKIQPHDVQMHKDVSLDDDGISTPFAWSLAIHVGIIAAIIVSNLLPDIRQQPPLETTLINADQLATIKSQVLANRSQAMKSKVNDPNTPTQATSASNNSEDSLSSKITSKLSSLTKTDSSQPNKQQTSQQQEIKQRVDVTLPDPNTNNANDTPVFEKSPETIAFEKKMAETLKQHDLAMKSFETEAERKAQAKLRAKAEAEEKERQKIRQRVEEIKALEAEAKIENKPTTDESVNEQAVSNQAVADHETELKANKSMTNSLIANGVAELASKQLNAGISGEEKYSMGASVTQTNSGSMATAKIKRKLLPPTGSGYDSTTLTVTVDEGGRVIRASAMGTNSALNQAAEQAAIDASPLPVKLGEPDYPTFVVKLHGRGNKTP